MRSRRRSPCHRERGPMQSRRSPACSSRLRRRLDSDGYQRLPASPRSHQMPGERRDPLARRAAQEMLVRPVLLAAVVAVRNPDQRHAEMIDEHVARQAAARSSGSPARACPATAPCWRPSSAPRDAAGSVRLAGMRTPAFSIRTSAKPCGVEVACAARGRTPPGRCPPCSGSGSARGRSAPPR